MKPVVVKVEYVRLNPTTVKATMTLSETATPTPAPSSSSWSTTANANPPIVLFDVSASMGAENRFERSRTLVRSMIERCGAVRLIAYDNATDDLGTVTKFPATLDPEGQTSFCAAYDAILKAIQTRHASCGDAVAHTAGVNTIVFMTDGQDTTSRDTSADLRRFKQRLADLCSALRVAYVVHTVGIDASEADAALLVRLALAGSVEGTFGVFPSSRLSAAAHKEEYDRLVDLVAGASSSVVYELRGTQYALTASSPTAFAFLDDARMDCPRGSLDDEIDYFLHRLNAIVTNMNTAEVKTIIRLRDDMHAVFVAAGRPPIPVPQRKTIRQRLDPLNQLVRQIYDLLHAKGPGVTFSNTAIAGLNVAAREARDKSKSRFLRTAVDRSDRNAAVLAAEDEALRTLMEQPLPMTLEESVALSALTCTLTQSSCKELVEEGDCLGVGIRAMASEVCMRDPTQLVVEGVGSCLFSASEFLAMSTHAVRGLSFDAPTSVIRDATGLQISGVLPLFINDAHWRVAKFHLLRMAGHLCCKDPLMGTPSIILYAYLLTYLFVKRQAAAAQPGTAISNTAEMLRQTLLRVYADKQHLLPTPDAFLSRPAARVSSALFSPHLLLEAYEALNVPFDRDVARVYADEEVVRREYRSREPLSIADFFTFSPQALVDPFVKQQVKDSRGQVSPVASRMAHLMETVEREFPPDVLSLLHSAFGKIVRGEYASDASGELIDYGEAHDPLDAFEPVALVSDALMAKRVPLCMKAYSPDRLALVLLQASRRNTEEEYAKCYRDWCFALEDEVRAEFVHLCLNYVRAERVSAVGKLVSANRSGADEAIVAHLAANDVTLLERVAMMHGMCYVGRNVTEFSSTVRHYEEQRMICEGRYDISRLIGYTGGPVMIRTLMDKTSSGLTIWSAKSSNVHRMIRAIEAAREND